MTTRWLPNATRKKRLKQFLSSVIVVSLVKSCVLFGSIRLYIPDKLIFKFEDIFQLNRFLSRSYFVSTFFWFEVANKMPCWYYEKKDLKRETPSIQDGIDFETESRYRKEGARFIIDTGTKMGLRYDTMATGVVYFHRFYMFHSFKEFPRYVTACCW